MDRTQVSCNAGQLTSYEPPWKLYVKTKVLNKWLTLIIQSISEIPIVQYVDIMFVAIKPIIMNVAIP